MLGVVNADAEQVKQWLQQANIRHYICEHCHGLHLSELQEREGVVDARLFVEEDGILLTTMVCPSNSSSTLSRPPWMPRCNCWMRARNITG